MFNVAHRDAAAAFAIAGTVTITSPSASLHSAPVNFMCLPLARYSRRYMCLAMWPQQKSFTHDASSPGRSLRHQTPQPARPLPR